MRRLLTLLLAALPGCMLAQSYDTTLIPGALKKGARVVIRDDEMTLEIKSPSRAVTREKHVYTILNENGDNLGGYSTRYDKFTSINSITGTLFDEKGKELKRVKKKDMEDRSAISNFSLMEDERVKEYNFYHKAYPYTVAYEEEDDIDGLLFFPGWRPLYSPGISTQHSKYVIIAPKDYLVRYKPVNCNYQPVITESGDKKIYTWEVNDLPARQTETAGPGWNAIAPRVLVAPSDFEAQGYKGNMSSWENYGKFMNQLLAGRDVLPDDIKKKVHALTDGLKDTRQKVYVLYDFMQKNTHYISVQLGIGGFQPFPADYVATKRYGDCKALSNYMVALLKEAGISGRYVLIWSDKGAPSIIEDFPSMQGDHAIACVPMEKDTIWLECTSQTVSPDFMGSFTGDRKAILMDDRGAHIVRTPVYTAADNLQYRVVNATINGEGNLEADVNTMYTGIAQEEPHGLMNEASQEQRERYLNGLFHLPTYQVDKSHYEEQKGTIPVVKEYLHVISPNYASVTGRRLFITPNLFDKSSYRLQEDTARKYEILNKEAFRNIDSITISLPAGYQPESVPQAVTIDNQFGKYSCSVKVLPDRIVYFRSYEESIRRFPSSDYASMVKFYEQLYKADHSRVVLVKKE